MSLWTHMAGIIRVDSLCEGPDDLKKVTEGIKETLGRIITFEDLMHSNIDEELRTSLPQGREGSLQYQVTEYEGNSVLTHIIVLWGDLRDYGYAEDKEYVKTWWKNSLEGIQKIHRVFDIRQAVFNVYVEGQIPSMTLTNDDIRGW